MANVVLMNQDIRICRACFSAVATNSHGQHLEVCTGVWYARIPWPAPVPPVTYPTVLVGATGGFLNGWSDMGSPAPPTAYRTTADGDLYLIVSAVPGTFGSPMFMLHTDYVPQHTMTVPAADLPGISAVITVQGKVDQSPGAVTATRSGTPPGTIQASARIPLTL